MTLVSLVAACRTQADDIREQRALWRDSHVRDYVLAVSTACYCDSDPTGSRVTVQNGIATAVVKLNGLPSIHAQTMDDLFDIALDIAESPHGDAATLHYDPREHVITLISTEGDPGTVDDELTIEVKCFSKDVTLGCPALTKSSAGCAAAGGRVTPIGSLESPGPNCPDNGFSLGSVTDQADAVCCWTLHG
jgi:hypothetical protein